MYSISNEYRAKMLDQVQTHRLVGTIDGISFTDNDVIGVSYSNQCTDKKVNVGSVFTGVLKLTFLQNFLSRGDYYKKVITISDGLLLGYDEDEMPIWEDIPVGKFYIAEATWRSAGMIDVVAYDCLSQLDSPCEIDTSLGTVYGYCKYIETMTQIEFGMTQAEVESLPNGDQLIEAYPDNDIITYRDLLSYLAAFCGGFAYGGRDGKFYLKNFGNFRTVDIQIPKNRRISNAKFSDFETAYDAISYTNMRTGKIGYFGPGNWTTCDLGANPFLQYGSDEELYQRRFNILGAIAPMLYTPYTVSLLPAFIALDLADVIEFTDDYTEDSTLGGAMQITWTYNKSVTVSCFGENPNIEKVKSSSSKSISRITQNSVSNEITYYNYSNVDPYTFGSDIETRIAKLRFSALQKTTVKIYHEFIFDMLADLSQECSYEIHYYLDDELIRYKPYERIGGMTNGDDTEFSITRDLFYIIRNIEPNHTFTWEVRIVTHGVTQTEIDVNHIHITLEGQKLYGEDYFAGIIEVEDNLKLFDIGGMELVTLEEGTGQDAPKISFTPVVFNDYILTEAGDNLCTESGDRLIL